MPTPLFHDLLDAHGPSLRRLVRGYEADPDAREELLQDILVALWRALPSFRGDASLRTFVLRIAHNVAARHVARAVRRPRTTELPEALPAEQPDTVEALSQHQRQQALFAAVRALSLADQQVALLHLEGLANTEIAEITGTTASNVGTRLSRIRTRLARRMGGPRGR
jgi:RNA polymerase sigma-70 factor (ECF subfamily)